MLSLKILSFAAFAGSVAWLIHAPDYEPAIASITTLSALIATLIADQKQKNTASMHQSVKNGGIGIQAGGNIDIGKNK